MNSSQAGNVSLGISKLNGGLFIADQDTLIRLKICFRPYRAKYEYKRFDKVTVYAMTRGCEKLLIAHFNKHRMDVRVMLEYTARKKAI